MLARGAGNWSTPPPVSPVPDFGSTPSPSSSQTQSIRESPVLPINGLIKSVSDEPEVITSIASKTGPHRQFLNTWNQSDSLRMSSAGSITSSNIDVNIANTILRNRQQSSPVHIAGNSIPGGAAIGSERPSASDRKTPGGERPRNATGSDHSGSVASSAESKAGSFLRMTGNVDSKPLSSSSNTDKGPPQQHQQHQQYPAPPLHVLRGDDPIVPRAKASISPPRRRDPSVTGAESSLFSKLDGNSPPKEGEPRLAPPSSTGGTSFPSSVTSNRFPTFSPSPPVGSGLPLPSLHQQPPSPPHAPPGASRSRSQSLATGARPGAGLFGMSGLGSNPWDSVNFNKPGSRKYESVFDDGDSGLPAFPLGMGDSASNMSPFARGGNLTDSFGFGYGEKPFGGTINSHNDEHFGLGGGVKENGGGSGTTSRRHSVSVVGRRAVGGFEDKGNNGGWPVWGGNNNLTGSSKDRGGAFSADELSISLGNALNLSVEAEERGRQLRQSQTGEGGGYRPVQGASSQGHPSSSFPIFTPTGGMGSYHHSLSPSGFRNNPHDSDRRSPSERPSKSRAASFGTAVPFSDHVEDEKSFNALYNTLTGNGSRGHQNNSGNFGRGYMPPSPAPTSSSMGSYYLFGNQSGAPPTRQDAQGGHRSSNSGSFGPFAGSQNQGSPQFAKSPSNGPTYSRPGGYFNPIQPPQYPPAPSHSPSASNNFMSDQALSTEFKELGKGVPLHGIPETYQLYIVSFKADRTDLHYCGNPHLLLQEGDMVRTEGDRGLDIGTIASHISLEQAKLFEEEQLRRLAREAQNMTMQGLKDVREPKHYLTAKRIFGRAQPEELALFERKTRDEAKALAFCQERAFLRRIPMVVRDAEYQMDRRKLTFYYESDRRVDFRDLVKELFRLEKTRIWFSQIQYPASVSSAGTGSGLPPTFP